MTNKLVSKNIFFICLIALFSVSSCLKVDDESMANKEFPVITINSQTTAEKLLSDLDKDLSVGGYDQSKVDVIIAGSQTAITTAGLTDSSDLRLLTPVILRGAETSLGSGSLGLLLADKLDIIDITISLLETSLNGQVTPSAKEFSFSGLLSPNRSVQGEAYAFVMQEIAKAAVQSLDEAGIVASDMDQALKAVMNSLAKYLSAAGVIDADVPAVTKAIVTAAVGSLDEANIDVATNTTSVQAVVNGVISGLGGNGSSSAVIMEASDQIAEGAVIGLADTGVSDNDLTNFTAPIKAGVEEGFTNSGLTTDDYNAVAGLLDTAITSGIETVQAGATGTPGITVGSISGNTSESGTTATFTVVLDTKPTSDVTISLSSDNPNEGTVSPTSLTFTSVNWNAPQTVSVTGVDDALVDGNISFTVILGIAVSTDSSYNGINPSDVTVINSDNETPATAGFSISLISGDTFEDGTTATFTVKLNAAPTSNVTIDLSSSKPLEGTVSPTSLTFTPLNWNANQAVTVTGVNDDVIDGDISYIIFLAAALSQDTNYLGLNPNDVLVTNIDDDSAGFIISTISNNTTEAGGQGTFTVKLTSEPTANVTIPVLSSNTGEGTVPASITIIPADWNALTNIVTVTGVADGIEDGNQAYTILLGSVTSADTNYNGLNPADVSVINNDVNGVAPVVSSTMPSDGGAIWAGGIISITFNEMMDAATISTNTADTSCSGSIQISQDNFATCVQMTTNPVASNADQTFTVTPVANLTLLSFYQIKVSTGVTDLAGYPLATPYQTILGFMVTALPDTGQTTCYNQAGTVITCPAPGAALAQDGSYPKNPMSFTDNLDSTVTDNNTGLMWQQNVDAVTRTWDVAGTYCTGLTTGGYTDWRLPNENELMSIVDYGTFNPSINTTLFPGTVASCCWSSTPYAGNVTHAWHVYFLNGVVSYYFKTSSYYVRCVRGTQTTSASFFIDMGDGTVTDNTTGLMWQQADDATTRTWEQAITYCEGLSLAGFTDWRLPNVKELGSMVDNTVINPSINTVFFPSAISSNYWSSTTYAGNVTFAWYVVFSSGDVSSSVKTSSNYVRCVR